MRINLFSLNKKAAPRGALLACFISFLHDDVGTKNHQQRSTLEPKSFETKLFVPQRIRTVKGVVMGMDDQKSHGGGKFRVQEFAIMLT
jgi:hypothetical protein